MAVVEEGMPKTNDSLSETVESFLALLQDSYKQSFDVIQSSEVANIQKLATDLLSQIEAMLSAMASNLKVRPREMSARQTLSELLLK